MDKDAVVDLQFKKGDMIVDSHYDRIGILMSRSPIIPSITVGEKVPTTPYEWGWKIIWTNGAAGHEVFKFTISRFVDQLTSEHRLKQGIGDGSYQYYTIEES